MRAMLLRRVLPVVCCLWLAACGSSFAAEPLVQQQSIATATIALSPTDTFPPTVTPTATSTPVPQPCQTQNDFVDPAVRKARAGDLLITAPNFGFLSYPGNPLAGSPPISTPYEVPDQSPTTAPTLSSTGTGLATIASSGSTGGDAVTHIGDGGNGLVVTLCNTGLTAHTIQSLGIKVASYQAWTTALNIWIGCDSAFDSHGRGGGPLGCGGALGPAAIEHAQWPQGTTADAIATVAPASNTSLTFPLTLAPNTATEIYLGMDTPQNAGTFTFDVSATIDGQASPYLDIPSLPIIIGPVVQAWSGGACLSAPWQAKIPTTVSSHYYVCPLP